MNALGFWQLLTALIALLVGLRLVTGWLWQGVLAGTPGLWRLLTRFSGAQRVVAWLNRHWPRLSTWLQARFSLESFTGLPLTLMLLLAAYLSFLGAGLVEDLFQSDQLTQIDQHINAALGIVRDPDFLDLFAWITAFGNNETLSAITLVTIGFLWAHGRSRYIPGLLVAILGSQIVTWIGKLAIDRPRPEFITFATAASPSFPSAHATGAIAVYGFIAYAIARDLPNGKSRFELAFWSSILIALIAFSRLVLSVHYPSDVAAGLLVGGFWLLAGFALTEYLRERHARKK